MLTLAANGKTWYTIVIAREPSASVEHAARELAAFLKEITGAEFPVVRDNTEPLPHELVIGKNRRTKGLPVDWNKLGYEGYRLLTSGDTLYILGSDVRGALYGVYALLEDLFGCRFFTEDVRVVPKRKVLTMPKIDRTYVPPLEYREPYFKGYDDGDFHARLMSNGSYAKLTEKHGGKMAYYPFVHSFDKILDPAEWFDTHPEYFSEVDGVRVGGRTQLCLTNSDVLRIAKAKVREWITAHPEARIISVSQNDWLNYCTCESCRAVDEYEGSHAGTLLRFVNAIAEDIAEDYPDILIDTLAYRYTRTPPLHVKPRENVCVRLCSIECCFAHPLEVCAASRYDALPAAEKRSFADDLRAWSNICKRLYVWDYIVNFKHTLMPFANLYVLQPNIRFMIAHNVRGIFEEGNNSARESGELNALRQYIVGKLLWNPDFDVKRGIAEFLTAYYGQAAAYMQAYIDLIHAQFTPDTHMWIYDNPDAPYLPDAMLDAADNIFNEAERVANDDTILKRVRKLRLSVRYVRVARMPKDAPGRDEIVERFINDVRASGVTSYREGKLLADTEPLIREGTLCAK